MAGRTSQYMKLRWITAGVLVLIVGSSVKLTGFWLKRVDFSCDWYSGSPILPQLLYLDWGSYFAVTEHHDPDKPGYILCSYHQWQIGPVLWRKPVYQKP